MGIPLKELRKSRGITQAVLSKALNISPSTVGMWEQGRREPDYDNLKRIATYFGVSTDILLGFTNKRPLTAEQIKLLKTYDSLDLDGQYLLNNFIESLHKFHARKEVKAVQKNNGNGCTNVINVESNNPATFR